MENISNYHLQDNNDREIKETKTEDDLDKSVKYFIEPVKSTVHFDDVICPPEIKKQLLECTIFPLKFPKLFPTPIKKTLVCGVNGVGKTYLIKSIASIAENISLFHIHPADFMTGQASDGGELVKRFFNFARETKPCIVFLDDLEFLTNEVVEESSRVYRIVTELLVQINGVAFDNNNGLSIVGACGAPWKLCSIVRRKFAKIVYLPLQDRDSRTLIIKNNMKDLRSNLKAEDFAKLGLLTERFSASDLTCFVREVSFDFINILRNATHFKKVTGPSPENKEIIDTDLWLPCESDDCDAVEMTFEDVPEGKFSTIEISMEVVLKIFKKYKPTISSEEVERIEEFVNRYANT
ncbi:DgyrCDS3063 [Dimorphilus gyrociliatus]|uniref:DgyrCDS3063 n=1 Tax=Dimorphilus gyrociliatus TaxID=2664684 RepID=A0A7I8VEU9_9ANNE|nr:DgyrCDS3063 [Dimorphilus gyrociliatus]